MAGKIKTLYEDEEYTDELFPRTKISAISDSEGNSLEELLRHFAKSSTGLNLVPITRIEYEALPVEQRDNNNLYIIMD